jgi:multicomponent K+:H+ antiporter subunit G
MLPLWADALIALLLVSGAGFALIGSWGLAKFGDFYKRVHGPTKATTLGVGGVLIASALHFSLSGPGLSVHQFLITLFLFMTAPVSAHLLVQAAMAAAPHREPGESGAGGDDPRPDEEGSAGRRPAD